MNNDHKELALTLATIQGHEELSRRLLSSTDSQEARSRFKDAEFEWIGAYLNAFYSQHLMGLTEEIVHRNRHALVIKPVTTDPHHWGVTVDLYKKKMVTYCDRIVAPIDLSSTSGYIAFWNLVATKGTNELITKGLIYPIPTKFRVSSEYTFDIGELEELGVQPFSASEEAFRTVFTDATSDGLLVPLPHVRNLDLDTLLKLRADYEDDWLRFQATIRRFLMESKCVTSEARIVELVWAIDEEVRKLTASFQSDRFVARREGIELALQGAGFVLSLVTPDPELRQAIGAVMGTLTAAAAVQFFTRRHEAELRRRAESPFFFPWKVAELDRQAAGA